MSEGPGPLLCSIINTHEQTRIASFSIRSPLHSAYSSLVNVYECAKSGKEGADYDYSCLERRKMEVVVSGDLILPI